MSPETLRLLERLHALAAWAATTALVASAWLFLTSRSPRRAARVVGSGAVALTVAAAALGLALHDPYRLRLRQRLFVESPALGWLFERKQSAAFAVVLFGVSALAALVQLERTPQGLGARDVARSAAVAWSASALLALAASIASAIVARHAHF